MLPDESQYICECWCRRQRAGNVYYRCAQFELPQTSGWQLTETEYWSQGNFDLTQQTTSSVLIVGLIIGWLFSQNRKNLSSFLQPQVLHNKKLWFSPSLLLPFIKMHQVADCASCRTNSWLSSAISQHRFILLESLASGCQNSEFRNVIFFWLQAPCSSIGRAD